MKQPRWADEFPGAITVCDAKGIILYMNEKACRGGVTLIGQNILDCHPEPALTKLRTMLKDRSSNCYTIEKKGIKKLICQSPWYESGRYKGFVELSLEIPFKMPHFVRGNG